MQALTMDAGSGRPRARAMRGPPKTPPRPRRSPASRDHMAMRKWLILAAALVVAGATDTATAAENLTSARTELAPTGNLRVGILVGSLGPSTFYTVSDSTAGLRGVTIDLAGALARELRVPLELVPYSSAEALNQSATAGAWDVTFMTVDHHRQTLVDFGPAYVVFEATYLVPSASTTQSIADVDQPGIRASAIRQGGLALRLSQSLRNARLYQPALRIIHWPSLGGRWT